MAIYLATDHVTIYHGDCLDILPTLARDSADLLVTDPPYGVQWSSNRRAESFGQMAGDDSTDVGVAAVRLALNVLKNRRHLYVFGPIPLDGMPVGGSTSLVWDKLLLGSGDLSSPWGPAHEPITFAAKCASKVGRKAGDGRLAARLRSGSVLRHKRPNGTGVRHPSEKPVGLLRELIEASSKIGDVVLDPFGGSGSTAVAAVLEGRRAILIEREERWCELAAQRVRAAEVLAGSVAALCGGT